MRKNGIFRWAQGLFLGAFLALPWATTAAAPPWMPGAAKSAEATLLAQHGDGQKDRIQRGLRQVTQFWRDSDGDAAAFAALVQRHFAGTSASLDSLFQRFDRNLEQINGHANKVSLELKWPIDVEAGPILAVDELFAAYDPGAHLNDDFFQNKLAFVALLNFPLTTLNQRLTEGPQWSRRQWAEARLALRFSKRVPAEVNQALAEASTQADLYVNDYNLWMHHLLSPDGKRLFPPQLRLLSHWNLRDQIRAEYSEGPQGLPKQRLIQKAMEHIVAQTIPAVVIDNPAVDWDPTANRVQPAAVKDADPPVVFKQPLDNQPEADRRYAVILRCFHAARKMDPYSPTTPTLIDRRFQEDREIPEERARALLEEVLASPVVPEVARLIAARLGRPLEPFDVWYNGFLPRGAYTEAQLDQLTAQRYPDAPAFKKDLPRQLAKLGFTPDRAESLARNIEIDPARGSGHAWGAAMRSEKAHLRTRVEKTGMNYKGLNIALHELGHNIEQTFSLNYVDFYSLQGVPNNAFTEAIAYIFQAQDLPWLDLPRPDAASENLRVLNDFWITYEIAGVGLVDMAMWHWMYDHPQATPAELKTATLRIAQDIWNRFYAPVFARRDVVLLSIYSHLINNFLYLPDYAIGHLISFQIEEKIRLSGNFAATVESMARQGCLTPDLWMQQATGSPVSARALLSAAAAAVKKAAAR